VRQDSAVHFQEVSAETIEVHVGDIYSTPSPKRTLIFISADFNEFKEEIQVFEETLEKLGELYGGIECFSSYHSQLFQERKEKIQESALYIGIFGDDCGLIDRNTQKPLIELEYEVAKAQNIPCLIYFKQSQLSHKQIFEETTHLNYEVFKNRVVENGIVKFFQDTNRLEQEFIRDFIKNLRDFLFEKVEINQYNSFSLDSLHLLCRASINQQIRSVGRDKYIPDIYLERGVEEEIESFVNFDQTFLKQADKIIDDLIQISHNYRLRKEAYEYLSKAKIAIRNSQTLEQYYQVIDGLKKSVFFDEIENIFILINYAMGLSRDTEFYSKYATILSLFKELPCISSQALSELPEKLLELRRRVLVKEEKIEIQRGIEIICLNILPAKKYDYLNGVPSKWKFANDLIKEINNLVQIQAQKCIALVGNAGYGKTNVICHLADSLSKKYPVVLLSGQVEITGQYNIEYYIQRQLESFLPGNFFNWMNRIKQILDNPSRQCLFILIDGINENSNLPLFIRLLRDFIIQIEDKRIKIILSCRNIFWDLFSATLKPSLFKTKTIELNEFNEQEINQAIRLYFKRFNIQSSFDASNLLSLRNPLLLRFFCEAYRDCQLDKVSNLELLSVFNLYVERVEAKIVEQLGLLRTEQIIGLLTKLGHRMWLKRKTSLKFSELEITPEEASKSTSIYNLIRSENLIFEESLQFSATQRNVRFLYDEFMEYIIARSWLEQLAVSQELETKIEIILQEAVSTLSSFSPAFGAIIFLDKMLKRNGELVNRIISLLATSEDEFVASRQIVMLQAFEKIDINNVGSELIIALDKFERTARDEIKEKLAPIIVQVLCQHPNHPITKDMIRRMLEVGNTQDIASEDEIKEQEQKSSKENEPKQLRLPPGRYHYKEEMKLNAISILVGSKNTQDFALIEEGINSLGKMQLHSALTALTSLDLADDELLYKMLSKYYDAYLSEYRIYCAWLLRNRYGSQPAEYLTGLLMDKETRVHRYTLSLFEKRRIEKELIVSLIAVIQQVATIKPWHLINLIKILGKKNQFYSQYITQSHGQLIVSTLINLCIHPQASLRLEAYRYLMQYDEFIERKIIISAMEKDKDIYVRRFAVNQKLEN
jgi:energy-coupling factor transporter ATP-binding protein EcfA2